MRDVVSASNFANVNNNGNCNYNNASNTNGVRPDSGDIILQTPQRDWGDIDAEGKAVPALRLNNSGTTPESSMQTCTMEVDTSATYTVLNLFGAWDYMITEYIMETVCDMNYLYGGFHKSMNGSDWKEEPQRFERDYLSELSHLQDDLIKRTYRTLPGSEFKLMERGHIRHIHGGRMRDRVVRHTLCDNVLSPTFERYQVYSNGASQTGKGVDFARKRFERDLHNFYLKHGNNKGYVQFVDFSKFYDNIRHDKVKEIMLPYLDEHSGWLFQKILESFKVDVSYMTDEEYACCLDMKFSSVAYYDTVPKEMRTGHKMMAKGVDIGDQVSQNIGVFFPTRIDNYVTIVRGIGAYGRYMDDMYMIHEDKEYLKETMNGIIREAETLGLFVNEKKTRLVPLSSTFTYLQRRYFLTDTGKVVKKITPKAITRERRRIKAYKRLLDKGEMTYPAIEQAIRSWMGGNVKVMSKEQVSGMKQLYYDLFGKELRWK